jgi:ribosomal protein L22
MTSLWNRIKSTAKKEDLMTISSPGIEEAVEIESPWTITGKSSMKTEPIRDFWIRTPFFRVSSQKLNLLGRQITRLPLPMAILQMKFTKKKAGKEVYDLLMQAQARIANLTVNNSSSSQSTQQVTDPSKFIVQQATVGNGPYLKRIDIKGRGRHGVIWRPHSFMRIQVALPDEDAILKKRFRVRIHKENKPAMLRLNY